MKPTTARILRVLRVLQGQACDGGCTEYGREHIRVEHSKACKEATRLIRDLEKREG